MVGKITSQILSSRHPSDLQKIYDKYPGKCHQWNAAFMMNGYTPDVIKRKIKAEDNMVYDLFINLQAGNLVATAATEPHSNSWNERIVMSRVQTIVGNTVVLENGNSIYGSWIGFKVVDPNRGPEFFFQKATSLPAGYYFSPARGFLCVNIYSEVKDAAGFTLLLEDGEALHEIFTKDGLFNVFRNEEASFEKLAAELEDAKDTETYSKSKETMIEFIAQLFSQEERESVIQTA